MLTGALVYSGHMDMEDMVPDKQSMVTTASFNTPRDYADAKAFAIDAARLCADSKCSEVTVFDVQGLSPLTSFIVIATGTSDRQIRSVADDVAELGGPMGFKRFGSERDENATWVVADFVDVVVHLFEPAMRAHYDLEMLWGDAPRVSWRRG